MSTARSWPQKACGVPASVVVRLNRDVLNVIAVKDTTSKAGRVLVDLRAPKTNGNGIVDPGEQCDEGR